MEGCSKYCTYCVVPYPRGTEVSRPFDDLIAEVADLPGVMTYGSTRGDAVAKAKALALRVIADRLEHGEEIPESAEMFAVPA